MGLEESFEEKLRLYSDNAHIELGSFALLHFPCTVDFRNIVSKCVDRNRLKDVLYVGRKGSSLSAFQNDTKTADRLVLIVEDPYALNDEECEVMLFDMMYKNGVSLIAVGPYPSGDKASPFEMYLACSTVAHDVVGLKV